jgi:hypothetical protein
MKKNYSPPLRSLFLALLLLSSIPKLFAQAPCDATFTGLTTPSCSSNPSVTLTATTPGGTFSGPGITGNTFNPTTAGVGTHNITYSVAGVGGTYAISTIPFISQPAVANLVTLGDDAMSTALPIGFTFNFFGNAYTQFEISSNGFITFNLGANASGCCQGQVIPNAATPNNLIAAVWDDLYPPGAGTLGYQTFGTAPNRTLVVSWFNTPFCCGSVPAVTSSIVLYETSNIIEIHSANVANATPATMGIENLNGTAAYAVAGRNSGTINVTNDGVRFTPSVTCLLNSSTQSVTVNQSPVVIAQTATPTLCGAATGQLNAVGTASTYTWMPGSLAGGPQTVTPASTTIYTVTGTSANGCTKTSTVTINVNPQPSVTIAQTPPNPICGVNPTLTANATGGGAGTPAPGLRYYVRTSDPWGTGNNTTAMNAVFGPGNWSAVPFSTPAATIFTPTTQFVFLEGSDANAIDMNNFVTANITAIQAWVNSGGRLFMNAGPNGGGNMTWGFGGVTLNYNSPQGTVTPTIPAHPIHVGPFTPLAASYSGNSYSHAHITGGATTALISGGGVNVLTSLLWGNGLVLFGGITSPNFHTPVAEAQNLWQNIISYTATTAVAPTYTYNWMPGSLATQSITPVSNGTYTVTVTAAGCPSTATTTIVINPAITVNATASINPTCAGAPTVLTATGANTYNWMPGNLTGSSVTVNPLTTTTYTVTGSEVTGCTATTVITINVTALPPIVVGTATPNPVCIGYPTTLTASGSAISYTWAGAVPVTDGVPFIPPASGIYTVTGTAANGCTATDAVQVNVQAQPNIGINVSPNDTVCFNTNITLGGTGGSTYSWSSPVVNNTAFQATATATYTVTGTDLLGCTNTATIEITVNPLPNVFVASVMPNDSVCDGTPVTLTAGGNAITYNWTNPIQNGVAFTPPAGTNTYGLQGIDAKGCINYANQQIVVNIAPTVVVASVLPNDTICANSLVTLTGGGANSYTWTGSVVDNTPFTIMSSGNYTVTGTDINGCTNTASITMYTYPTPAITITSSPSTGVVCGTNPVILTANGGVSYSWSGGVTNGAFFYPPSSGVYTVIATDGNSCTVTSTTNVTVSNVTGNLALTIGANINSISGSSTTSFNQPAGSQVSYYNALCNLISKIELGPGVNLGNITTQVIVSSSILTYNGQPYVRRRYVITPATNGPAVNVTLPLLQADFNSYNLTSPSWPQLPTGPADLAGIANIRITKVDGGTLGVGTPTVITPATTWNGTFWELSFPVTNFSEFYVHSANPGNVPLPVSITNFSGEKHSKHNVLHWTTSQEMNNDYFTLQHSTDGMEFRDLGKIASQGSNGSSATPLTYSFIDQNPVAGHNYYRLMQTDLDQNQTQHAQVVDLIWGDNGSLVSIFPNPTNSVINVDLFVEKNQNTRIHVLDMSGRIVVQVKGQATKGNNHFQLDLSELAEGVYTVQVFENNTLTHVSKINKMN